MTERYMAERVAAYQELAAIAREAMARQTAWLAQRGLDWERARAMTPAEQAKLQADWAAHLAAR
jgi:hypothetical protein